MNLPRTSKLFVPAGMTHVSDQSGHPLAIVDGAIEVETRLVPFFVERGFTTSPAVKAKPYPKAEPVAQTKAPEPAKAEPVATVEAKTPEVIHKPQPQQNNKQQGNKKPGFFRR